MTIRTVELRRFTVFDKLSLELVDGVNVFIGANATGKTHAMKAIYAGVRAIAEPSRDRSSRIADTLDGVFKPVDHGLQRLAHRQQGQSKYSVRLANRQGKALAFSVSTSTGAVRVTEDVLPPVAATFLPSREGLAMYEGFASAYEKRELSFDATYYDLAIALGAGPLRGPRPELLSQVISKLENTVGGRVHKSGGRFYLRGPGGALLEAHLVSEGYRKLMSVLRLLQNGELRETALFLWDEPEANLNPELTVLVADVLATMARGRVQVVLATHDYLLSETLALMARGRKAIPVRFFCFRRTDDAEAVEVSWADDLNEIDRNPIRGEFLRHYDRVRAS